MAPADILVISETWFMEGSIKNIPNYKGYHVTRPGGRGGGISIYVRDNLESVAIDLASFQTNTIEINTVKLKIRNQDIHIIGIYRPHSDSISNFTATLRQILETPPFSSMKVILTGDLNINLLNIQNDSISDFIDVMQSSHYLPVINKPTRFPPNHSDIEPTCLDHYWLNFLSGFLSGIITTDITDHCAIFMLIPIDIDKNLNDKIKITFRDTSNINKISFLNEISSVDWDALQNNDVSIFTENFLSKINNIYTKNFPIRTKFLTKKRLNKPWLNREILNLTKAKSHYFKLLKNNLISLADNNMMKNRVNYAIRKAKSDYLKHKFNQYRTDVRKTWYLIRDLLGVVRNKNIIKTILFNNVEYTDAFEMAQIFNNYFTQVANELEAQIPQTSLDPLSFISRNAASLELTPVTVQECTNIIQNLKNTNNNPNHMPTKVLKENCATLAPIITKIVNECFITGNFPMSLKLGIVTPIYKKGPKDSFSNYRPITSLPYLSKIIEKLLYNRIDLFLIENDILCNNQYGFRRGKSTEHAVLKLMDFFYDTINNNQFCISIFIDYQKAFDTINHIILLGKLEKYGIRGTALALIKNYITDRKQQVRLNASLSDAKCTNIGLPQGSVISPLLFLLYINDINYLSTKMAIILYADDTTLVFQNNSYADLINTCNTELEKFRNWSIANRLSLNVNKTHVLLVSNRTPDHIPNIYYGGNLLEVKNNCTFLGVIIDDKLKFVDHIKHISNKISKSVGILYKLKDCVPKNILIQLYYSLAYPYIQYCNLIYANTFNTHLDPLIKLQKKLIRAIDNAPYLAHTNNLFFNNRILKLDDINKYCTGVYMFKNRHLFVTTNSIHNHNTRQRNNLRTPFQRTCVTQQSMTYRGPLVWNSLPPRIRGIATLDSFKNNLKTHLLSNYQSG